MGYFIGTAIFMTIMFFVIWGPWIRDLWRDKE